MTGFTRWLLRRPAQEAKARVFCFPYSGVGASMFNRWPRWLDGDVEVCPVQFPARENRVREPHFGTYQALSEDIAEALAPHLDRPYTFFGHCAGALPAYETALRLAESGHPEPARLVVSAQAPPHHCPHDRFLDLDDAQLGAELGAIAVARGGEAHPQLIELTLSVLHQDLEANRVYTRARTPLPGPVSIVNWSADPEVDLALLDDWRGYSGDVRFHELPGEHYTFLTAPPELLTLLRKG